MEFDSVSETKASRKTERGIGGFSGTGLGMHGCVCVCVSVCLSVVCVSVCVHVCVSVSVCERETLDCLGLQVTTWMSG